MAGLRFLKYTGYNPVPVHVYGVAQSEVLGGAGHVLLFPLEVQCGEILPRTPAGSEWEVPYPPLFLLGTGVGLAISLERPHTHSCGFIVLGFFLAQC